MRDYTGGLVGGAQTKMLPDSYFETAKANAAGNQLSVGPTIASAVGQMDALNSRLDTIVKQVSQISDQIGGPRPVGDASGGQTASQPGGAVHRLSEATGHAHSLVAEIEQTLNAISRALG